MYDLSKDFFQRLAICSDEPPLSSQEPCTPGTQGPYPTEPPSVNTEESALDAAALGSLRQLFLLLDEWDRAMTNNPSSTEDSSAECKTRELPT
jgi:hypothetical protein